MGAAKKFKGYWWVPPSTERQWAGVLKWKPSESPRLTLDYKSSELPPPEGSESFCGLGESGAKITVLRAGSELTHTSGFLSNRRYYAGHILEGVHVDQLKSVRASKINISLQYLGDWLDEEGFDGSEDRDGVWKIHYQRPDDRSYDISDRMKLKVCHSAIGNLAARKRSIEYDIFFSVEKVHSVGLSHTFRWIDNLRHLLHFARLRPIHATRIDLEGVSVLSKSSGSRRRSVKLYTGGIELPIQKHSHPPDFVFMFKDIENRFGELLSDWFSFCVKQREAMGCYMTTIYLKLPTEVELICLTQALEAYHEQRFHPPQKPKMYFQKRIAELGDLHSTSFSAVVGDIRKFSEQVRDTRNYYTHHDPAIRRKGNVVMGRDLIMMTIHLQYLFRLCVLSELDIKSDPFRMLRRQMDIRFTDFF